MDSEEVIVESPISSSSSLPSSLLSNVPVIMYVSDDPSTNDCFHCVLVLITMYVIYTKKNSFSSSTSLFFALLFSLCCTPCVLIYALFFLK